MYHLVRLVENFSRLEPFVSPSLIALSPSATLPIRYVIFRLFCKRNCGCNVGKIHSTVGVREAKR